MVIAFSLLVEEENPNSPNRNRTIALIKSTEDYDNMAKALKKVAHDVKTMSKISVNGVKFSVEFFLGAYWKFLALTIGIKSASAKHFCIWCKCTDKEWQIIGDWSIEDPTKGARTIYGIEEFAKSKKRGVEKHGCVNQPLFPTIPIDHVVPDVLHLFLRITDVLINLLINYLR